MKYLMVWMGKTSGTLMGRDDGYPEEKSVVIESFDELMRRYRKDASYYKLTQVDVSEAVQIAKELEGL